MRAGGTYVPTVFVGVYATQERYDVRVSKPKHYYMHNNPVKRGLVRHPGNWPWSSCRSYFWNAGPILGMDKML